MKQKYDIYITAVCAVIMRDTRFLSLRRAAWKDASPGVWEAVSGRLEPGEQPLEAVSREISEETGLTVTLDPRPLRALTADRAGLPMTVIYYRAASQAGEPHLSDEHDRWEWLTPAQFRERSPLFELAEIAAQALADPAPFYPVQLGLSDEYG